MELKLAPDVTITFDTATEAELRERERARNRERRRRAFHDRELRALGERIYGASEYGAWPAGALAELEERFPYPWPLKDAVYDGQDIQSATIEETEEIP